MERGAFLTWAAVMVWGSMGTERASAIDITMEDRPGRILTPPTPSRGGMGEPDKSPSSSPPFPVREGAVRRAGWGGVGTPPPPVIAVAAAPSPRPCDQVALERARALAAPPLKDV